MFNNPVLTNTDSIDFAELAPSIVARAGRISTTNNNVTTSTTVGRAVDRRRHHLGAVRGAPPIGAGAVTNIAVSADGATLVWDIPANTRATPAVAGGLYVSRDHGASWTASTGIGALRPVFADRVNPSKFYVYDTAATAPRFYVSTDGGGSFTASAATGLPRGVNTRQRALAGIEGDIWLVTVDGAAALDRLGRHLHRGDHRDDAAGARLRQGAGGQDLSRALPARHRRWGGRRLPLRRRGRDLDAHRRPATPVGDRGSGHGRPAGVRAGLRGDERAGDSVRRHRTRTSERGASGPPPPSAGEG